MEPLYLRNELEIYCKVVYWRYSVPMDDLEQAHESSCPSGPMQLPSIPTVRRMLVVLLNTRHAEERNLLEGVPLHVWLGGHHWHHLPPHLHLNAAWSLHLSVQAGREVLGQGGFAREGVDQLDRRRLKVIVRVIEPDTGDDSGNRKLPRSHGH